MNIRTTRHVLTGILLAAFVASLAAIVHGYLAEEFFEDDFTSLAVKTVGQYAGPLSIVAAAYFADADTRDERNPSGAGAIAVLFTALWCVFTAGRTVMFILSRDETVDVLTKWNTDVVPITSFLIDGTLAYFFVSAAKTKGQGAARPTG